jgi:hypothetical protein
MAKFRKYIPVLVFVLILVSVVGPYIVMAASGDTVCGDAANPKLCNPIKFDSIQCFFKEVLRIAAEIGAVFVVVGIIYSGFMFVQARGNAEELGKAKRAITYTVIGAALVLGAWAFSVGIANTINTILNGSIDVKIQCP